MRTELAVSTPAFLDLTVVGLEALPGPGEERFGGDLLRSPGGGAITAVAAARLGLQTALVAPLGNDMAGTFVRSALEDEGIAIAGFEPDRTPQTIVLPVGGDRTMVTVDPGIRARAADIAGVEPVAVAGNLEQVELMPDGARIYLTCGDDDARAFARRLPAGIGHARGLFLSDSDALTLTGAGGHEEAAERLAETIETVIVTLPRGAVVAFSSGRRVEVPEFDIGPIVDTTGDRDLVCAAYAWADMRGAEGADRIAWAQLYSRLSMAVPTATAGAVTEERLLQEGEARGLARPSGVGA